MWTKAVEQIFLKILQRSACNNCSAEMPYWQCFDEDWELAFSHFEKACFP